MQGLLDTIKLWHIHPAVDHFTVALLIVAVLADLFASLFSTRWWLRYAALALMIAGTAAAWGSQLTGGWEAHRVWDAVKATGGPGLATLQRHAWLGDWLPWIFLVLAGVASRDPAVRFYGRDARALSDLRYPRRVCDLVPRLPRGQAGLRLRHRHRAIQHRIVFAHAAARGHRTGDTDSYGLCAGRECDA